MEALKAEVLRTDQRRWELSRKTGRIRKIIERGETTLEALTTLGGC